MLLCLQVSFEVPPSILLFSGALKYLSLFETQKNLESIKDEIKPKSNRYSSAQHYGHQSLFNLTLKERTMVLN